jgi:UDP-2-acetamido-2,6-beta-L-arabino-hexul-4-ose reductase
VSDRKKILVTGAKGFIGKNLIAELRNRKNAEVFEYDIENSLEELDAFSWECELVIHLAGGNRPKVEKEFKEGNFDFTKTLLDLLKKHKNKAPIIFSSSIQAKLDNPYGKSKLAVETILMDYSLETGIPVSVYRLPNVFGKWCRPSYNSVVATFCHNIANGLPVQINDPFAILSLIYIDDVINEFINKSESIFSHHGPEHIEDVKPVLTITLGKLAEIIRSFRLSREDRSIPDFSDYLTSRLYATYLSYLPISEFSFPLKMHIDNRGSFTEFIRTPDRGQVSVNILKPGIVKGNHWHHTKNEKFLVVSGTGVIRFRKVGTKEIIEYHVNGEKLEVVDIVTGYTHNIENLGTTDLVTIMWACEPFNPEKPDTIFEEVQTS